MHPYIPEPLPPQKLDHSRLIGLVGQANAALARYDGLLQGLVNPEVMLSPLTTQEAVLSSRIEGTQATLEEVLEHDAGQLATGEKQRDIQEIVNYRNALRQGRDHMSQQPVTLGLVRQLHRTLLDSARGQDKTPGAFRKDQNWIGSPGCRIEEATFVPPNPLQLLDYLQAWEHYLAYEDVDPIMQTAIVHAQFELLHPFRDGNGRIGRLLIPLFLYQKAALSQPMFYLSAYLEENRDAYYAALQQISRSGDWNIWITFFMTAVTNQALRNTNQVQQIRRLYEGLERRIVDTTHSQYASVVLHALFQQPIFRSVDFVEQTELNRQTAAQLLRKLKAVQILEVLLPARGRRAEVLVFPELLDIVHSRA
jgi:Fic family protein